MPRVRFIVILCGFLCVHVSLYHCTSVNQCQLDNYLSVAFIRDIIRTLWVSIPACFIAVSFGKEAHKK